MSEKLLDFEWMEFADSTFSYEDAQVLVAEKNRQLGADEKRWRIAGQYDLRLLFSSALSSPSLKHKRYWCRSSMQNRTAGSVDSSGKVTFFGEKSLLHLCLIRDR